MAQDITGGGSLVRDITGGAALIFRAPQNPTVQVSGATGGGRVKAKNKPPVRKQDPIIARANAARSAAKPRYAEAESSINSPRRSLLTMRARLLVSEMFTWTRAVFGGCRCLSEGSQSKTGLQRRVFAARIFTGALNRYPEAIDVYHETLKRDPTSRGL